MNRFLGVSPPLLNATYLCTTSTSQRQTLGTKITGDKTIDSRALWIEINPRVAPAVVSGDFVGGVGVEVGCLAHSR